MKVFESHRKGIRLVSFMVMLLYILTVILSVRYTVSSNFCVIMILLTVVATIMQLITCFKNIVSESSCNGHNSILQGLLLWVVVFVVTLGMF